MTRDLEAHITTKLKEAREGSGDGERDKATVDAALNLAPYIFKLYGVSTGASATPVDVEDDDGSDVEPTVSSRGLQHMIQQRRPKNKLFEEYMAEHLPDTIITDESGRTQRPAGHIGEVVCCGVEMQWCHKEATYSCVKCARCQGGDGNQYETTSRYAWEHCTVRTQQTYDIDDNFMQAVNNVAGEGSGSVPDEVLDCVAAEIKRCNLTPADLDHTVLHRLLRTLSKREKKAGGPRTLRCENYYKNIPFFLCHFAGQSRPTFSDDQKTQFAMMFSNVGSVFWKVCGDRRGNMISKNYLLFKFCELCGFTEFLPFIPLVKLTTIRQYDVWWKTICEELGWEFTKTVPCTDHRSKSRRI